MIRAAVAKVWGPSVSKEIESRMPDCTKCRRPGFEEARVTWGCDRPAQDAVFSATCAYCAGAGCEECEQTGNKLHKQCPSAVIAQDSAISLDVRTLLEAYRQHDAHGILPAPGALLDQSASYVAAVGIIDEERGHWEKLRSDHHRQKMERSTTKNQAKAGR